MKASAAILFLWSSFQLGQADTIGAYWHRLSQLQTEAELRSQIPGRLEQSTTRRVLFQLRQYEISRNEAFGRSVEDSVRGLLRRDPRDLWMNFALGEILAVRSPRRFPLQAARQLEQALHLDSLHAPSVAALGKLGITSSDRDVIQRAITACQILLRSIDDRDVRELLPRLMRMVGDTAGARVAAETAVEIRPTSGHALYALSRAQLLDPRTVNEGYVNYLKAADSGGLPVRKEIAAEILLTRDKDAIFSLDDFRRSPSEVLNEFWTQEGARDGRTAAERLAEHYRRLEEARRRFPRVRSWRIPVDTFFARTGLDPGFDERGYFFVRYGEPDEIVRPGPALAGWGAETWVYDQVPPERIILHFGLGEAPGQGMVIGALGCTELEDPRLNLDPKYGLIYTACRGGNAELKIRAANAEYREFVDRALRRSAYIWRFGHPLDVAASVLGFRSPDGHPEYIALFAVRALPVLKGLTGSYDLLTRFVIADSLNHHYENLDTLVRLTTNRPLAPSDAVRANLLLRIQTADAPFFRLVVRSSSDSSAGVIVGGPLSPDSGSAFALSDIVIADTSSGGTFVRGGIRLNAVPGDRLSDKRFRVYYEVYGLKADEEYETEIAISQADRKDILRRLFGGKPKTVTRFSGRADGDSWRVQEIRTLSLDVDPGLYRLDIAATKVAGGQRAARSVVIRVPEPR